MSKFKFNYVPEDELSGGIGLLTPGQATFKVKDIFYEDKDGKPLTSKNNDPKVRVVLVVKDCKNVQSSVYEDITPKTNWKIYGLLKAVGRKDLYDESGVDFEVIKGLSGGCEVGIQSTPGYSDRTVIAQYHQHIKYDLAAESSTADFKDDDLDF